VNYTPTRGRTDREIVMGTLRGLAWTAGAVLLLGAALAHAQSSAGMTVGQLENLCGPMARDAQYFSFRTGNFIAGNARATGAAYASGVCDGFVDGMMAADTTLFPGKTVEQARGLFLRWSWGHPYFRAIDAMEGFRYAAEDYAHDRRGK
jgi:hypothetical protein